MTEMHRLYKCITHTEIPRMFHNVKPINIPQTQKNNITHYQGRDLHKPIHLTMTIIIQSYIYGRLVKPVRYQI